MTTAPRGRRLPRPGRGAAVVALAVTLGACSASSGGDDATGTAGPSTTVASSATSAPAATTPVSTTPPAFLVDRLEDAGYLRNDDLSDGTRAQYQDTRCVVQLLVVAEAGPGDDAADTELALASLGAGFGNVEERPGVELPVDGGSIAMQARRLDLDTGTEVVPMQMALRVLGDLGTTVAVTHGCYDHVVTDAEFEEVIALLLLQGVAPSGF